MIDLLDARGYEVQLNTSGEGNVNADLEYLGAVVPEADNLLYRNDRYVVSHVENEKLAGSFSKTVKDTGISKSGLKLVVKSEVETDVNVTVCKTDFGTVHLAAGERVEKIYETSGLCEKEKEYLKEIHDILYKLLSEIDRVCMENDIEYYLVFGGLLGYVRYGEIIPWDDDVDVAMTRENFEKFRKIADKKLGKDFKYLDCGSLGEDAFLDFLCRVVYMKSDVQGTAFDKVDGRLYKEYENKLPMDIYVLDNASDIKAFHKLHMFLIRAVYGLGMGHRSYLNKAEYSSSGFVTRKGVELLSRIGRKISLDRIMKLHDRVSMMFNKKKTKSYFMSNGYLPFIHTKYLRRWFEGTKRIKLGEIYVNAPTKYRSYLKRAYYDYYHLPPVEKRIPGHMKRER